MTQHRGPPSPSACPYLSCGLNTLNSSESHIGRHCSGLTIDDHEKSVMLLTGIEPTSRLMCECSTTELLKAIWPSWPATCLPHQFFGLIHEFRLGLESHSIEGHQPPPQPCQFPPCSWVLYFKLLQSPTLGTTLAV